MDPQSQFCHNPECTARGQVGQGNLRIHSRKEQRYRCLTCGKTFAATAGTPLFRLHHTAELMALVLILLCHGCPLQAIVAAYGLDERTVARWQAEAGQHSQAVHQHLVAQGKVDLGHVQADEVDVKVARGRIGMAMALAVPSRLWLGGVLSPQRDLTLITALVQMVRTCARTTALLVCVDGLSSYVTAFLRVFRHPVRTGKRGRPRLELAPGFLMAQVIKQYAQRRITGVVHRVVQGTAAAVSATLLTSGGGTTINTAYIERINATFRSALTPLVRRGRAIAHKQATLHAGMWLVGTVYNFCWEHEKPSAKPHWRGRDASGSSARRRWPRA